MVVRIATFFCLVAAAAAVAVPVAPVAKVVYAEPEAPANYDFEYSIQDQHSGDIKQQKESRSGDAVHGYYSLVQPDGTQRIVEYTADKEHGFNAVVRYEGQPTAPAKVAYAPAPVYAAPVGKVAYAPAPITKVAYAPAPVTNVAYAAPVAKVAYAPAPVHYAAQAPVNYAAPAPVTYAAPSPVTYAAPAPVAYAAAPAPVTYAAAPAPVTYAAAPVAKVAYAHAPVTKVAYAPAPVAKVAYSSNIGHVTFSSPAVSYQH
ncbi:uncharacterized protein ACR2FA_000296 [Aphomia sociella]